MNEQGAKHFTHYVDSTGRELWEEQIGIWESARQFIPRACFSSQDGQFRFCVEAEPPAIVYYGRERYNQYNWRGIFYLSWSGVDIEIGSPQSLYRYRITMEAQ
jgi:hypothetical protein